MRQLVGPNMVLNVLGLRAAPHVSRDVDPSTCIFDVEVLYQFRGGTIHIIIKLPRRVIHKVIILIIGKGLRGRSLVTAGELLVIV